MTSHLELYKSLCQIPSVMGGRIWFDGERSNFVALDTFWRQRDLERNEVVQLLRKSIIEIDPSDGSPVDVRFSFAPDEVKEIQRAYTQDGDKMAIFRKVVPAKRSSASKSSEICEFLDIYDCASGFKLSSYNLTAMALHGRVHSNLGKCHWFSDGKKLLYVAEKYRKTLGYTDSTYSKEDGAGLLENDEFVYRASCGEQMSDVHEPVIVSFNTVDGGVLIIENFQNDYVMTEPAWLPDGSGIIYVAIKNGPVKLGLKYCLNRESEMTVYDFETNNSEVIKSGYAFSSLRFSPDAKKLVYFECDANGAHQKSMRLIARDWSSQEDQVLIDSNIQPDTGVDMPGLYLATIPERCWCKTGSGIFFTSVWGSKSVIMMVNVHDGNLSVMVCPDENTANHSWELLDVYENFLLSTGSSPNRAPYVALARLVKVGDNEEVKWLLLSLPEKAKAFHKFNWKILNLRRSVAANDTSKLGDMLYEAVYIQPVGHKRYPLVVIPHGGPHSVCLVSYSLLPALLGSLGFAVLQVNYRGSVGYGCNFLKSLLGKVGDVDVHDCYRACLTACEFDSCIDHTQLAVCGGSHGGFIALHLIGQFPSQFRACVAINAVANISAMYNCTDIPDWCVVETLAENYEPDKILSVEKQAKMWYMSPICHAEKVITPTLFLFGGDDLRVPPSQAREFVTILKAKGVPVRILNYPSNSHSLDNVDAECDFILNSLSWLSKYLSIEDSEQE